MAGPAGATRFVAYPHDISMRKWDGMHRTRTMQMAPNDRMNR